MAIEERRVEERRLEVQGAPAWVHTGGEGLPIVLLHGGWGGAALHWSAVWERLAERYRVVAPDLPGLGRPDQPPVRSVAEAATWVLGLLDALAIPSAWLVGNSFGASVAWRIASKAPGRCLGLVMVNGIPMPRTPTAMRWLGRLPAAREQLQRVLRRNAWTPAALEQAFADPGRIPAELASLFRRADPPQLAHFVEVLIQGDGSGPPARPPVLLWGEADRLAQSTAAAARRLQGALPGSRLVLIPGAGHLPQLEQPEAFVRALSGIVAGTAS